MTGERGHSSTADSAARGLLGVAALAALLVFAGAAGAKPRAVTAGSLYYQLPPQLRHWLGPSGRPGTAPRMRVERSRIVVGLAGGRTAVVRLARGASPARAVARWREQAGVRFAEPDYVARIADLPAPNDPRFADQWGLDQVHARAGWEIYPGSYDVPVGTTPKIAIVDTGIDSGHEDLAGTKVLSSAGADCVTTATCKAWPASGSTDDNGHGTHVAGIAGATAQNGLGGLGVAYASQLIPVKACDSAGNCPISAVALGIRWAADHGAKVVNLSLALAASSAPRTLCDAVSYAVGKGAVVVAAAGNAPGPDDLTTPFPYVAYPAGCPGAIGVAAVAPASPPPAPPDWPAGTHEWAYGHPSWSNSGYPTTFVSAPGGGDYDLEADGIWSTLPAALGGPYQSVHSTSAAAPFVAGIAALLLGQAPTRTPADVRRVLAETALKVGRDIPNGDGRGPYGSPYGSIPGLADPFHACTGCTWHPFYGYGEADAGAALLGVAPTVTSVSPTSAPIGGALTLTGADLSIAGEVGFAGGATAPATVVSSSKVTVKVPPGAKSGALTVTTTTGLTSAATAQTLKIAPVISGFTPTAAKAGAAVTINGTTLDDGTILKLNGVPMTFTALSSTQLQATVPDTATTGKITVATFGGTATSAGSFGVKPTVQTLTPDTGAAGTAVAIGGKTLVGVSSVKFSGPAGTEVAAPMKLVGGVLTATVPATAISGPIFVTNAGGTSPSDADFTVVPKVTAVSPAAGAVGGTVTVTGTGFDTAAGHATTVSVNGTALDQQAVVSPTKITGKVALGSTTGAVTATGSAGPLFKVTPTIALPGGPVQAGDTLTLTGTNLDDGPPPAPAPQLKLGSAAVAVTVDDSTHLHFTVPDAVSAKLTFATKWGSFTTPANLLIKPKIGSPLNPTHGAAGAVVTVPGTTFAGTSSVKLNGVPAAFKLTGAVLAATVPAAATTGSIAVTNAGGTDTSPDDFVVDPSVKSVSPAAGPVGTLVTITGSGFGAGTIATFADGGSGIEVTPDLLTPTVLKVTVPHAATSGPITLSSPPSDVHPATAAFGVSALATSFDESPVHAGETVHVHGFDLDAVTGAALGSVPVTLADATATTATVVVPDAAVTAPLVLKSPAGTTSSPILPVVAVLDSGAPAGAPAAAGASLVFSGTFAGIKSVLFAGTTTSASFGLVDAHHLKATIPPGAISGPVTVSTAGGPVSSDPVIVLPKVTSFSTSSGVAGSTVVTIGGSGFQAGAAVSFNGLDAPVTPLSATQLKATVPNGATSGAVTVTNPDSAPISKAGFTVTFSVTGIDTLQAAGKPISIQGVGFSSGTKVTFAGAAPVSATLAGGTLTATVPAGAQTGPVKLTKGSVSTSSRDSFTLFSLQPSSGPTGTDVHVHGAGFSDCSGVTYAGAAAPCSFVSSTELVVTVPDGADDGDIAAGGVSDRFTVTAAISGLSATSGAPGSDLTVSGKGFGADPTVTVAGLAAAVKSASDTAITVTVPGSGGESGHVVVSWTGGGVRSKDDFTITGGGGAADSPQFAEPGAGA